MKKTLYISDLDGTLLRNNAVLSPFTIETINNLIDKGMLFTISTGRGIRSTSKLLKDINLKLPISTKNGTVIIDSKTSDIKEVQKIQKNEVEDILKAVEKYGLQPHVSAYINGEERISFINKAMNELTQNYNSKKENDKRLRPVDNYKSLFEGDVFIIIFIGTKKEMYSIEHIFQNNPHINYHIMDNTYIDDEYWLEVFHKNASKGHALLRLKELYGADEVVCFGDNINDLAMFENADRCYAVSNSNEVLKNAATAVIGSNEEDAIAIFLLNELKEN